jgi:TRAP-type C4-dicarboxylate transport system substrate-binding protein
MKRNGVVLCGVFFLLAATLAADPALAVRIKLATKAPENFKSAGLVKKMAGEIEQETNGNVRFKIYYGGVKGTGRDLLLKMKSGEIHGGEFTAGEASSVVNDLQILSIPFLLKDYDEVDFVFERMRPYFEKRLQERGYVVLGWLEVGFGFLMSVQPIASRGDLLGRKVWIPQGDRIGQAAFEAIGVPPIPMTISDVMVALQTGQIDTVGNSLVGAIALQWHTRIRYITDVPLLYIYGLLMITRQAYEEIPPEYRKTVSNITDRTCRELKEDIRKNNAESRQALMKEGIRFLPASEAMVGELEQTMAGVRQELAGKEFSAESLQRMNELLEEFRSSKP